jgi:hypothetical protein
LAQINITKAVELNTGRAGNSTRKQPALAEVAAQQFIPTALRFED